MLPVVQAEKAALQYLGPSLLPVLLGSHLSWKGLEEGGGWPGPKYTALTTLTVDIWGVFSHQDPL